MLERNLAQGLALLADIDWETMETTLSPYALEDLEAENETLEPPAWPSNLFGDVDMERAQRGCETFSQKCAGCHQYEHTTNRGSLEWRTIDVGTDGEYCKGVNAATAQYQSVPDLVRPVAAEVKRVSLGHISDVTSEAGRFPVIWRTQECNKLPARSLEGIWSAAPYLHNGSVMSINDLLRPAKDRAATFYVGSIEYDPSVLGFKSIKRPHTSLVDTSSHGFSNSGHEFVVPIASDRTDVIEYLKVHRDGVSCEEVTVD